MRRHGTRSCYVGGCRCEDCRIANRDYQRKSGYSSPRDTAPRDDGIIDDIAIDRVLAGGDPNILTPAERREAIRQALAAGWTKGLVVRHLRVSHRTVAKALDA